MRSISGNPSVLGDVSRRKCVTEEVETANKDQ
jgi:hypothetical protein